MKINQCLASEIVKSLSRISNLDLSLMDENEELLATSNPESGLNMGGTAAFIRETTGSFTSENAKKEIIPILYEQQCVGYIMLEGKQEVINRCRDWIQAAAELVIQQNFAARRTKAEITSKEEISWRLLQGIDRPDEVLLEKATRYGIDLFAPRIAIVVEFEPNEVRETGIDVRDREFIFPYVTEVFEESALYYMKGSDMIILKQIIPQQNNEWNRAEMIETAHRLVDSLKRQEEYNFKVGIGEYYSDNSSWKKGLHYSFKTARQAVETGRVLHPAQSIYAYWEMSYYTLICEAANQLQYQSLKDYYRTLLKKDKNGELIETFKAFILANGDLDKVAQKVFVHRNTIRYRLRKIYRLVGKNPQNHHDLFELYLSMLLYDFNEIA